MFAGGLAAIMIAQMLALNAAGLQAMGVPVTVLMACSGMMYIFSIMARDELRRRREPWRFSLATLLIVMTIVACGLGLAAVWATRFGH
jgi:hypothetical protein